MMSTGSIMIYHDLTAETGWKLQFYEGSTHPHAPERVRWGNEAATLFRSLCWSLLHLAEPPESFKATGAMMCKPPVSSSFIRDLRFKPCSCSTTRACSITQHGVGPQEAVHQNQPPRYIERDINGQQLQKLQKLQNLQKLHTTVVGTFRSQCAHRRRHIRCSLSSAQRSLATTASPANKWSQVKLLQWSQWSSKNQAVSEWPNCVRNHWRILTGIRLLQTCAALVEDMSHHSSTIPLPIAGQFQRFPES